MLKINHSSKVEFESRGFFQKKSIPFENLIEIVRESTRKVKRSQGGYFTINMILKSTKIDPKDFQNYASRASLFIIQKPDENVIIPFPTWITGENCPSSHSRNY